MKFDQKRIDEAKAYLNGESKTPPPWLPENTQLREGKLYIDEKEVIPYEQRNEVLARMYADPKLTGGRDRLFEHVKEKYVGISRRDIMQYLRNNETHQTHAPLPRRETTRRIVAGGPNKIAQADLIDMGDLAGHNGAKRYVLTFIDLFSKWVAARPITKKTAAKVQAALMDILTHIDIKTLQTDRGSEFGPSLERALAAKGIKLIHSSAYKPTTQGTIERWNGYLKRTLYRLMDANDTKKWTDMLQDVVNNYNDTTHSVTGYKPNDLNDTKLTPDEIAVIQARMRGPNPGIDEERGEFKVGDIVRVALTVHSSERKKGTFRKQYKANWSTELFKITHISKPDEPTTQPQYIVKDIATGHRWDKKLWAYQLQKIDPDKLERKAEKEDEVEEKKEDGKDETPTPVEEKKERPRRVRRPPPPGIQRAARNVTEEKERKQKEEKKEDGKDDGKEEVSTPVEEKKERPRRIRRPPPPGIQRAARNVTEKKEKK
jgi:transposase InsO family protein